jgi:lipoprotein-anchoring transpeptidase ErfK/SrfK
MLLLTLGGAAEAWAQATAEAAAAPITSSVTGATFTIDARTAAPALQPIRNATGVASKNMESAFTTDGLSAGQLAILEKLNRVNAARLKRLNVLVRPVEWSDDELVYSPFPLTYDWAADKAKTIVVDQSAQAFAAYEFGQLVRWGPVSTGELGQTPAGVFNLSWRSRGHHSSVDPSWYLPWYFNFIPARGIAFHQYSLPGRAASHGCVRLLERDAQWLYHWGEATTRGVKGTTVVVLNCPDSSRPWQTEQFLRNGISLPASPSTALASCVGSAGRPTASHRKALR